jgi:hypothetical protein
MWFPTGTYDGVVGYIEASNLHATDHWVTNYIMVCPLWRCNNYMQEGLWQGERCVGCGQAGLTWYWEQLPNCYTTRARIFRTDLSTSWGTYYPSKITYIGGNAWSLFRNGALIGTTASCFDSAPLQYAETSGEITNNSDTVIGDTSDLQKRGQGTGIWSYNWGGSTAYKIPNGSTNPFSSGWFTSEQWVWYDA